MQSSNFFAFSFAVNYTCIDKELALSGAPVELVSEPVSAGHTQGKDEVETGEQ